MSPSLRSAAGWVLVGGFASAGFGVVAAQSESTAVGLTVGSIIIVWTMAAGRLWQREQRTTPVPAAEYLAAVWSVSYITLLVVLRAAGDDFSLRDALFVLPPIGLLPFVVRIVLRGPGGAHRRARAVAYQIHRVCGWTLIALGIVFVVSLYLIVVAPLPLVGGLLHISAASGYRRLRSPDSPMEEASAVTGRA